MLSEFHACRKGNGTGHAVSQRRPRCIPVIAVEQIGAHQRELHVFTANLCGVVSAQIERCDGTYIQRIITCPDIRMTAVIQTAYEGKFIGRFINRCQSTAPLRQANNAGPAGLTRVNAVQPKYHVPFGSNLPDG